jgi:hypothetical protein
MQNLSHSASLHAGENNAPSNSGIKHYWPLLALVFFWPALVNSININILPIFPLPLLAFVVLTFGQAVRSPPSLTAK